MTQPNFFLVGTTKGGTSTLHRWLIQHPDIYLPARKELHHFCACPDQGLNAVRSRDDYGGIFNGAAERVVGEASPCYMYYPDVANVLSGTFPHSRILMSLRDPVERFWSHYLMNEIYLPTGEAAEDILQANLRGEGSTALDDLLGVGMYYRQVERFLSVFGRARVFVTFLEHIAKDPAGVARGIQEFLGVDVVALDVSERDKQYVEPRNSIGRVALRNPSVRKIGVALLPWRVRRFLRTRVLGDPALKPAMSPDLRWQLQQAYRQDCLELEELLRVPLPWSWHKES